MKSTEPMHIASREFGSAVRAALCGKAIALAGQRWL